MSYAVIVEEEHVYVKYSGVVDSLDIVQLTADKLFIKNLRFLGKVVHDFSFAEDVCIGLEDVRDFAVLSNLESNFSEKLLAVIIPKSAKGFERVAALSQGIKSPDWHVVLAHNYAEALTKI